MFKAHGLVYHSTLGSGVSKKRKEHYGEGDYTPYPHIRERDVTTGRLLACFMGNNPRID